MPWCGYWGAPLGGFWWLMPLFGLAFMALMLFLCFRGSGWMARRQPSSGRLADLEREVASLKEEVRNLLHRSN